MQIIKTIVLTSMVGLLSTCASAASRTDMIENLPDGSEVTLEGTVENISSSRSFTLRDSSGSVKIDIRSARTTILRNGERVHVTGMTNKGFIYPTIVASAIGEAKTPSQQLRDTLDYAAGRSKDESTRPVAIKSLPESGLVVVEGTVGHVASERKFTVTDTTGNVEVNVKSEFTDLHKGAGVTVIGYVNSGFLGKSIDATNVETGAAP